MKHGLDYTEDVVLKAKKQEALQYVLDAWDEALSDGIDASLLANATLYAALTDMVETFGEDAVARMTDGLAQRIQYGEFTLNRITQ
jgi:hypothetical protein